MAIDCVVSQFGAYTAHKYVQHPHYYSTVSPQSLHTVGVQFYQDPNFMVEIPGNPLNVTAGTQVYVKVFTTDANWGEKMVVHDCYSEPASGSPTIRRYNLIRNGYVLQITLSNIQHMKFWYILHCRATKASASQLIAQTYKSLHCSHTQSKDVVKESD